MSISTAGGLFSAVVLAIWSVPSGLKWFAFLLDKFSVPYGPMAMTYANEICGGDAEERSIVLGLMNALGYAFNAWLPVLTYPAVEGPSFRKGFIFTSGAFVAQFCITWLVWFMYRQEARRKLSVLA